MHGPLSVTAPGAVAGWAALAERHGRLGLDRALEDAIDTAERGFAITPVIAGYWAEAAADLAAFEEARRVLLPAPRVGQIVQLPELAATLRRIASEGADGFYRGPSRMRSCAATPLSLDDLAVAHADWVEPLRHHYRGVDVCEIPPNGQGVAALQALGILSGLDHTGGPRARSRAPAGRGHEAGVRRRLPLRARRPAAARATSTRTTSPRGAPRSTPRAPAAPEAGRLDPGGTVYLCAVDEERNACSLIQSVYHAFGSQRRRAGDGRRAAEPRPRLHARARPSQPPRAGQAPVPHDHPGPPAARRRAARAVRRDGRAHAAAGPPAVRLARGRSRARPPGGARRAALAARQRRARRVDAGARGAAATGSPPRSHVAGIAVLCDPQPESFGGGQAVLVRDDVLIGGSEARKDGVALGY